MSENPTFDNLSQMYGDLSTAIDGINQSLVAIRDDRNALKLKLDNGLRDVRSDFGTIERWRDAQEGVNEKLIAAGQELDRRYEELREAHNGHATMLDTVDGNFQNSAEKFDQIYKDMNHLRERMDHSDQHSKYTNHTFNENVKAHRNFEMLIIGAIAIAAFAAGKKS